MVIARPFSWQPLGKEESGRFQDLTPIDILDWFDGPKLFTLSEDGVLFLAYACSESVDTIRYLIIPTEENRVDALKRGSLTLLEALRSPLVWVADVGKAGTLSVKQLSWSSIPSTVIPRPHVLLSPGLEPMFQVYAEGRTLFHSAITAGLLRKYADASYLLLQRFFQSINWAGGFDPPIRRLSVNSLELAFELPGEGAGGANAESLAREFQRLIGDHGDPTIVYAILKICPFQNGGTVDSVTLSGKIISEPIVLKRGDRPSWRQRLSLLQQERVVTDVVLEGRVEEIDWGRWTFTLREVADDRREVLCRADENIVDELRELYGTGNPRVRVHGIRTEGETYIEINRYEILDNPRVQVST
jgi:hypothetical protein